MSVKSYRDLLVWQKAILAAKMVYWLVKRLPREELFALSSQMRRAAISIPSNIAEGHARNSTKEFLQFLSIAKGSKAELETQLILCVEINYLSPDDIAPIMALLEEIGRMINSLIASLTPKPSKVHTPIQSMSYSQQFITNATQPVANATQPIANCLQHALHFHTPFSTYYTTAPYYPNQPTTPTNY